MFPRESQETDTASAPAVANTAPCRPDRSLDNRKTCDVVVTNRPVQRLAMTASNTWIVLKARRECPGLWAALCIEANIACLKRRAVTGGVPRLSKHSQTSRN